AMLLATGFAYVTMVLCGRSTPFESGDNRWNDWLGVMLSAPALYLFAMRHTLLAFGGPLSRMLRWNVLGFVLPYFVPLHWEYVGKYSGANFSLTARQLAHLNRPSQIALAVGAIIFLSITALCLREAQKAGYFLKYLGTFLGLVGAIAAVTLLMGPDYHF